MSQVQMFILTVASSWFFLLLR